MRMSNETRAENAAVNRSIDDLVKVLKGQNADPRAAARCLQQLAKILKILGEPAASALVHEHFDIVRLVHAD